MIAANRSCPAVPGDGLVGTNMARRYATARVAIANWSEVARAGLARLQRQLRQAPPDQDLEELVQLAEAAVADLPPRQPGGDELVVCPHFRVGDQVIRTITIAARFDDPLEVTLAELRSELSYPQDEDAERFFRAHARGERA